MRTHYPKLALALLLLLALAWRLLLWAQPLHLPANDEVEYLQVARDLLAGRGWVFYDHWRWLRAPLYPLFLAGSLWLAAGDLHLAALPNLGLSLGVVGVAYALTRNLSPAARPGPALLAAALAAGLQTYATFASLYMSETLFALLFGLGLLGLARWHAAGGLARAGLAGALLGLACLARSAGLIFLPVAGLWMIWGSLRTGGLKLKAALPPLALGLGAAIVIAPWTLHTCRAYGRCILIETGGAYNLWAFYEPHEDLGEINIALEAIRNPAERADLATQRGLARLREDPSILLRKIPAEWQGVWTVKPIEDRFLRADNYSDPPAGLFLSALVLDDLLYLLLLCAAPFGLALARRNPVALLLGLWVALFVLASLLTHAEGRYRHFLFVAMIPLAAVALAGRERGQRLAPGWALAAGAFLLMALLAGLSTYPWGWAGGGALRSIYRAQGDQLAASGHSDAAVRAYTSALQVDPTPDGWIVLGDLQHRIGDTESALGAYTRARALRPPYVGSSVALGQLLRDLGRTDEARVAFQGLYLDQQHLADWSFQIRPPAPTASLDVGAGLDYGYIGGVYPAEQLQGTTTRWTNGRGMLRLQTPDGPSPGLLRLRATAPRPDGAAVTLQVCAGRSCAPVPLGAGWRVAHLLVPSTGAPIELRSPTFFAADRRDLGLLIDWAKLGSLTP